MTVDGLPLSPVRVTVKLIVLAGPPGSPSVVVASAIDTVGRSLSMIVPVATRLPGDALLLTLLSVTVKCSSCSGRSSSTAGIRIVAWVSPAAIVTWPVSGVPTPISL